MDNPRYNWYNNYFTAQSIIIAKNYIMNYPWKIQPWNYYHYIVDYLEIINNTWGPSLGNLVTVNEVWPGKSLGSVLRAPKNGFSIYTTTSTSIKTKPNPNHALSKETSVTRLEHSATEVQKCGIVGLFLRYTG